MSYKAWYFNGFNGFCGQIYLFQASKFCRITPVQYSTVQYSNLHRQVAHSEARLGVNKAASLATTVATLNSGVEAVPHPLLLDSSTALAIIRQYDIVLDCTDNVATRWTILHSCYSNTINAQVVTPATPPPGTC